MSFKTIPEHERMYREFLVETIDDWLKSGVLIILNDYEQPLMTMPLIFASMDFKPRLCFDSGILRMIQGYKIPCKLDDLAYIIQILKQNEYLTKFDDKKGFLQARLNPTSQRYSCFTFEGKNFCYQALPFGKPQKRPTLGTKKRPTFKSGSFVGFT